MMRSGLVLILALAVLQVNARLAQPKKKAVEATNLKVEKVEAVKGKKELPAQNANGTYPTYPPDGPCDTKPYNQSCHGREVYHKNYLNAPNGTAPAQPAGPAAPAQVAVPGAGDVETPDVANGEIPTAGEAVGQQTGVDVPNPHQYTGAIVGGGVAGTLVTIAIFVVASYYVYIWNKELVDAGKTTTCGWKSVLCCLCCTPISCCFQIDEGEPAKK